MHHPLKFEAFGKKENKCLVFVHGFLGSYRDWKVVIEHLKHYFYCIAIDLPKEHFPISLSFATLSFLIHSLLHEQNITNCSLIGYSMGGRIALEYCYLNPSFIDSLVLISTNVKLTPFDEKREKLKIEKWSQILKSSSLERFLKLWYNQSLFSTLQPQLNNIIKKRMNNDRAMLIEYMTQLSGLNQHPFYLTQKSIKKGLFLYGEYDQYYKNQCKTLARKNLSQINFIEVKGSSHAIVEEKSIEVANYIRFFLEEL